ncbi:MAG: benzoate-CoA ligase family protein [Gemmatimonadales bacterium]
MPFSPPESFNIAHYFLDARIREGLGDRRALVTDEGTLSYGDVQAMANRFGHLLQQSGVAPEQRVIIALPDGPAYVAALFGILKIGAVVVMVNPQLKPEALAYFLRYTRAVAAFVDAEAQDTFAEAAYGARFLKHTFIVGDPAFQEVVDAGSDQLETFPSNADDAAIWLFSGGTTGRPKAVVQSHTSFANTTECYAKGVIGYRPDDVTLSVPKLYFGYATGSNLLFPFAVGATAALFPERCTADALLARIEQFRPTILINVPTMVNHLVNHPQAAEADLSSIRLATSAGEALPVELHRRWHDLFGVELLDGLGTAEMWHIFLSNRPGAVKPGTLGTVVPGFEVQLCDDAGHQVPTGQVGYLRVRGNSRALCYWHNREKTLRAFHGEWYFSEDMLSRDEDGYFTYAGRADDMLKVAGKWLSPQEVENCLLQHEAVGEVAVVGVADEDGLVKPHAYVVLASKATAAAEELQAFVRQRLEAYKYPREVVFLDAMPRTHLGKIDRGKLKTL